MLDKGPLLGPARGYPSCNKFIIFLICTFRYYESKKCVCVCVCSYTWAQAWTKFMARRVLDKLFCLKLEYVCVSSSVMSYSLWIHGLYPARLFCSCDSSGKNIGVGCQFLLWNWSDSNLHILLWFSRNRELSVILPTKGRGKKKKVLKIMRVFQDNRQKINPNFH